MSASKMTDIESGLIKLNNLQYTVPESLSVVISKQFKYFPSDKTQYGPKETIFATLSTGQQYIDLNESYFSFDMDIEHFYPGDTTNMEIAGWGNANPQFQHIMQLFRHIRITHFSGTQVWEDQYFASHWLQDRVFEVPYEKLKQELDQGKGVLADEKSGTDIKFVRRPGAYKTSDAILDEKSGFACFPDLYRGTVHGEIEKLEKQQRNLGYYQIKGKRGTGAYINDGQSLILGNNLDSDVKRQKLAVFPSVDKNHWVLDGDVLATETTRVTSTVTFHIPFHWIPFFRHEQNSLMPSMLANGMRVEFVLNDVWDFFNQAALFPSIGNPAVATRSAHWCSKLNYTIKNFRTNLQLVDLTSRIYALLLQESINSGLYWVTDATYTTMQQSVASSFMIECTRALSRCKMVKAIPFIQNAHQTRPTLDALTADKAINGDPTCCFSYASADCGFKNWRFMLGSMSYPTQNCEEIEYTSGHTNRIQSYTQLLQAYGYNDQRSDDGVLPSYYDFCRSGVYQACISLERSPTMQQTGLSLSTDASLRFVGTIGRGESGTAYNSTDSPLAIYVFVTYTSTCQIIGDKVIVKN